MQHSIPAHGNSTERARTLFNSIKSWLAYSGAADASTSDGVPLHEMQRFLDVGWDPALVQAEKDWILQSWPGKMVNGRGEITFVAEPIGGSSGHEARRNKENEEPFRLKSNAGIIDPLQAVSNKPFLSPYELPSPPPGRPPPPGRATKPQGDSNLLSEQALKDSMFRLTLRSEKLEAELAKARHENVRLNKGKLPEKQAAAELCNQTRVLAPRKGFSDDGYKLTVTLVEGEHIPTAASLWQEGKEFQAGFELHAHFCLVSSAGGSPKEEPVAIFKAKHSETPKWQQKVGLNINSGTHVDLVLRIQMMFSDGTQQPWGLLRLPLSEIIARGSHQGWFYLSDLMGDPFRNHNGDHAGVYLAVEVQESEVEHLKVQLLHAQEELEYLKQHQNVEIHEALEQALRCNQLLEATIGDLRDELKSAKDALLSQGKHAEEKLLRENEQLHEQLRAAWMSQQVLSKEPKLNAQYYDDKLRQEIRRLSDLAKTKPTGAGTPGQSTYFASLPTNFASGLTMGTQSGNGLSVKVSILAGSKLMTSRTHRCNPYCSISLGSIRKQTHVLSDTVDPHWAETFTFNWNQGNEVMVLTVFNRVNGGQDNCVGTVELDLYKIQDLGGTVDNWFPLKLPPHTATRDGAEIGGSVKLKVNIETSYLR